MQNHTAMRGTLNNRSFKPKRIMAKEMGEFGKNVAEFKKAIDEQISIGYPQGHEIKAMLKGLESGRREVSKALFGKLLTVGRELLKEEGSAVSFYSVLGYLNPTSCEAWTGLAMAHLLQGKVAEAVSCAWKAHEIDPQNVAPLLCAVMCLEYQGKWEDAHYIIDTLRKKKKGLDNSTNQLIEKQHQHIAKILCV